MKKLNKYVLALIVTFSFVLLFLGLSIGSAFYTVNRTKKSIDNIGKIVVDEDLTLTTSKGKIDKAITNYEKLDRNIGLDKKINNIEKLNESKKEFVNVSIILAISVDNQKVKLELSDTDVAKYVSDISDYQQAYITKEEFEGLANYADYLIIYEKYKDLIGTSDSNDSGSSSGGGEEEIEIC